MSSFTFNIRIFILFENICTRARANLEGTITLQYDLVELLD